MKSFWKMLPRNSNAIKIYQNHPGTTSMTWWLLSIFYDSDSGHKKANKEAAIRRDVNLNAIHAILTISINILKSGCQGLSSLIFRAASSSTISYCLSSCYLFVSFLHGTDELWKTNPTGTTPISTDHAVEGPLPKRRTQLAVQCREGSCWTVGPPTNTCPVMSTAFSTNLFGWLEFPVSTCKKYFLKKQFLLQSEHENVQVDEIW